MSKYTRSNATTKTKQSRVSDAPTDCAQDTAVAVAASPGPFSIPVEFSNAISALQRSVQNIAEEQRELIASVRYQGGQLEDLDKRFADVPEALKLLRALVEERDGLQRRVDQLEQHVDQLEQQARANNIEIRGVPVRPGEDARSHVEQIATFAGVPLAPTDISYVQRLRARNSSSEDSKSTPQQPSNIIVRFVQKDKRDAFLRAVRAKQPLTCKQLGFPQETPVYCNEHLTLSRKKLLTKIKSVKDEKKIKYVWVQNGTILLRKDDKSRIRSVHSYEDFLNMKL